MLGGAVFFEKSAAAFPGGTHIEQDEVGLELFDGLHGLLGVVGLATDGEFGLEVHETGQTGAEDRMIIDDEDALFGGRVVWRLFFRHGESWVGTGR